MERKGGAVDNPVPGGAGRRLPPGKLWEATARTLRRGGGHGEAERPSLRSGCWP